MPDKVFQVCARSNAAELNDLMAHNSLCIFMRFLSVVHFWIFMSNKYFVRECLQCKMSVVNGRTAEKLVIDWKVQVSTKLWP